MSTQYNNNNIISHYNNNKITKIVRCDNKNHNYHNNSNKIIITNNNKKEKSIVQQSRSWEYCTTNVWITSVVTLYWFSKVGFRILDFACLVPNSEQSYRNKSFHACLLTENTVNLFFTHFDIIKAARSGLYVKLMMFYQISRQKHPKLQVCEIAWEDGNLVTCV